MAFLIGQQGTGWTNTFTTQGSGGESLYYAAGGGYTTGGGVMGTAYVYTGGAVTASTLIVVIYNSSNNAYVQQSSPISANSGTGLQSAAITGTLPAGSYFLDVIPNSGYWNYCYNSGSSAFATDYNTAANNPYSSPLSTLPAADGTIGHEFIVWIDGTLASSATTAWLSC
jgi:hypothetical protein